MRRNTLLLMVLALLFDWAGVAHAQLWSGVLDPSRAIDWTKAGVPGGIPNRTTICANLGTPGGNAGTTQNVTTDQINSAIAGCPDNTVVYLKPGTYNLNPATNAGAGHSN